MPNVAIMMAARVARLLRMGILRVKAHMLRALRPLQTMARSI
jgi:hypothetical protein